MPFSISCPKCGARFKTREEAIGQTLDCPKCQGPITVAQPAAVVPSGPLSAMPNPGEGGLPNWMWGVIGAGALVPLGLVVAMSIGGGTPRPASIAATPGAPALRPPSVVESSSAEGNLPAVVRETPAAVSPPAETAETVAQPGENSKAPVSAEAKVETAAKRPRLRTLEGNDKGFYSLVFSRDGKLLLGGSENEVVIWDIASGKVRKRLEFPGTMIGSLAISDDGTKVVAGNGRFGFHSKGGTTLAKTNIAIWDLETGTQPVKFAAADRLVTSLCFSPSGEYVVSGELHDVARAWNCGTGKVEWKFEGDGPLEQGFAPDGVHVVTGRRELQRYAIWSREADSIVTWNNQFPAGKPDIVILDPKSGGVNGKELRHGQVVACGEKLWEWGHARSAMLNSATLQIRDLGKPEPFGSFERLNDVDVVCPYRNGQLALITGGSNLGNISVQTTSGVVSGKNYGYAEIWDITSNKRLWHLADSWVNIDIAAADPKGKYVAFYSGMQSLLGNSQAKVNVFELPD